MAIFIREDEVRSLLSMHDALASVEQVFRLKGEGKADNRPRQRPRLEASMLQTMPGAVSGLGLGLKAYTVTPHGVRFLVLLWDDVSGELLALVEAAELGRIRTGAASGVATKFLARRESNTVGMFGSGFQASAQLEAICGVRSIHEAYVYSRTETNRRAFAEEQSERLGIPVHPVARPEEAAGADIVVTITSSADPLFPVSALRQGAHLNGAGCNRAGSAEIAPEVFGKAARIFIDDVTQGREEAGDLIRAVSTGAASWERVEELGDLVAEHAAGRKDDEEITVFKSIGIAIEDIAVARRVYELALSKGAGEPLPRSTLG